MKTPIITRQLTNGKTLEIRLSDTHIGRTSATAYVDGTKTVSGWIDELDRTHPQIKAANIPTQFTHMIGGKVLLLEGEKAIIDAAFVSSLSPAEAQRLEISALKLEREQITATIAGIGDEQTYRQNRAWEKGDEMGTFAPQKKLEAQLEAAYAELKAFDTAHPEVLEHIKAERDESIARNIWN
jgi:hypothetical protein